MHIKRLVESWSDERRGQIPTTDVACELLLEYDRERQAEDLASRKRSEERLQELARERGGAEEKPFDPAELDDLPF
jgi:hypothetical protein